MCCGLRFSGCCPERLPARRRQTGSVVPSVAAESDRRSRSPSGGVLPPGISRGCRCRDSDGKRRRGALQAGLHLYQCDDRCVEDGTRKAGATSRTRRGAARPGGGRSGNHTQQRVSPLASRAPGSARGASRRVRRVRGTRVSGLRLPEHRAVVALFQEPTFSPSTRGRIWSPSCKTPPDHPSSTVKASRAEVRREPTAVLGQMRVQSMTEVRSDSADEARDGLAPGLGRP